VRVSGGLVKTEPISGDVGVIVRGFCQESIFDVDRDQVVELFKATGAILFRDFDLDIEGFNKVSSLFSTEFMTYRGGSYVRRKVNEGKDETLLSTSHEFGRGTQETFALPLHGEMYYIENRPMVLWFYCVTPAASDGETTICDGSLIYSALRPSTRALFHAKRLKYSRRYPDGEWQKIYDTGDITDVESFCCANGLRVEFDGATKTIRTEYVYPAVITSAWGNRSVYINNMLPVLWQESIGRDASIVRFEDGTKVADDVVKELVAIQQRLMIPISWQKQDLVMLDNTRFLHGRRAFADPSREICLRMARGVNF
jgi:alpha-ketoglutarate-dependent taurine dioxygenase